MFGLGVPEVVIHRDPVITASSWWIASCYIQFRNWGSRGPYTTLQMLTNLKLADLRLSTAQQRSTGQNLPSTYTLTLDLPDWLGMKRDVV
jgi:hypothetical protein